MGVATMRYKFWLVVTVLGAALAAGASATPPEAQNPPPLNAPSTPSDGKEADGEATSVEGQYYTVTLTMCVETDGRPSEVKVARSSGQPKVDAAAREMMGRTRMNPPIDAKGRPRRVCNYRLDVDWNLLD